jgi:hypothetical protein
MICRLRIESPPTSKKFSVTPTSSRLSTLRQTGKQRRLRLAARPHSRRGSAASGAGSAARSSLPFAIIGSAASTVTTEGTRKFGNRCASACFSTAPATLLSSPAT